MPKAQDERNRQMKRQSHVTAGVAAAVLAAGMLYAQETVTIDGSTTVGPIAKAFAGFYMKANPGVNITVSESGSGNGAKSLINGTCDIAIMSRFLKEGEFKAAVEKGVMPVVHVVALDGLPILVHPSNPVSGLTVAQVRGIYSGAIRNWKEVGGPDRAIVVVSRDTNSGTYETFYGLVMEHEGGKEKIGANAEYVGSNGAVRQRIQSTPAAIGYAGLGFVDDTVKALEIDGVAPSELTVISGAYPVARALYMFTNQYPKMGSHLYRFVTIHMSPQGEDMVKSIGFVPVTQYAF
jgi:phosphate transport system substrate-binding protein